MQHLAIRARPPLEAAQTEELVGSVDLLVHESPGEADRVGSQVAEEESADRNAAARADVVGLFAIDFSQDIGGCLVPPVIGGDQIGSGGPRQCSDGDLNTRRCVLLDMSGEQLDNGGRLLIGNQPAGYFGMRLSREDGFDAFTLETAPDAIHLQGGPGRKMLLGGVPRLSKERGHANPLLIVLRIEGNGGDGGAVLSREREDAVIEAFHQMVPSGLRSEASSAVRA